MNILSSLILTTGIWRAALITPGGELPFSLKIDSIQNGYTFTIINGEEHMLLDDVTIVNDSILINFPVYESELRLKAVLKDKLSGQFINLTRTKNAVINLEAISGDKSRFSSTGKKTAINVSGKWSIMFDPGSKDSSYAVGQFKQSGNLVSGTFLTSSGDYRYLDGSVSGDSLFLSTFNGVFVYLFKAKITGNQMTGIFYSGTHRQIAYTGYRDEEAVLPDADKLTTIKNGAEGFTLRFPDTDSNMVSLNDVKFKDKVVLIQIMGSWCPNCLDESMFLAPFYDQNKDKGFEIIGLSFEKTDDFNRASANVNRFKKRLNINYTLLVASNRDKILQTLPGLENFIGFPTTIFLDKNHKVRKVHAGFQGAATGGAYDEFKDDFSTFIEKLLEE